MKIAYFSICTCGVDRILVPPLLMDSICATICQEDASQLIIMPWYCLSGTSSWVLDSSLEMSGTSWSPSTTRRPMPLIQSNKNNVSGRLAMARSWGDESSHYHLRRNFRSGGFSLCPGASCESGAAQCGQRWGSPTYTTGNFMRFYNGGAYGQSCRLIKNAECVGWDEYAVFFIQSSDGQGGLVSGLVRDSVSVRTKALGNSRPICQDSRLPTPEMRI